MRVLAAEGDNIFDRVHPASAHGVKRDQSDTHAETIYNHALSQLYRPILTLVIG